MQYAESPGGISQDGSPRRPLAPESPEPSAPVRLDLGRTGSSGGDKPPRLTAPDYPYNSVGPGEFEARLSQVWRALSYGKSRLVLVRCLCRGCEGYQNETGCPLRIGPGASRRRWER